MRTVDDVVRLIPADELDAVLGQDICDIDTEFMGFTETYKHLAELIPKHFTVIDLGCAYAPQAYYFTDHKAYIGVDLFYGKRFKPKNAQHFVCSIQNFIVRYLDKLGLDLDTAFAICNYMPDYMASEIARRAFPNIYVFYPASENRR